MKHFGQFRTSLCALLLALALCCVLFSACLATPKAYFDPNFEGSTVVERELNNGSVTLPTNVSREGYLLEGWYLEKDCKTPLDTERTDFADGVTFYAKWTALPKSLRLSYGGLLFQNAVLPKGEISATVVYWDGTTAPVTDYIINLSNVSSGLGETNVSATYTENGVTVTGTLTVNVLKVVPLSISATYNGGDVLVGGTLAKSDITVKAHYNSGEEKSVEDFTVSGFSSDTAGNKAATISYTENDVTVTTIVSVKVVEENKLSYITATYNGGDVLVGGTLSKNEVTVKAHYTDGTEKTVEDFAVSGFSSDATGDKTVTVTYTESNVTVTATFSVKVVEKIKLSYITATYNGGDVLVGGTLEESAVTATAHYTSGTEKILENFILSGFSSDTVGEKTVTITYTENNVTVTITISVKVVEEIKLSSISATYNGDDIFVGGTLSNTDFTVTAHYSSGTEKTVDDFTVSGFSSDTVGTKTVTISYTEENVTKTTTIAVKVVEVVKLSSISARYNGKDIVVGETLVKSDVTVTAHYDDGTEKTVLDFAVNGFSSDTEGTKTVTISYSEGGVTQHCDLTIEVVAPTLQSISAQPSDRKIHVGDTFDNDFLVVTAYYSNNTNKAVTDFTLTSGWDSSGKGEKSVTVSYSENGVTKTATATVTVWEATLVSISAEYVGDTLYDDNNLTDSSLKQFVEVTLTYSNGSTETTTYFTLSGFVGGIAGEQTVTVSYGQEETQITVNVRRRALTGISASYNGTVRVGEQPDVNNFVVTAAFDNGSSQTVTNFSTGNLDSTTAGTKTLEISFTWDNTTKSCEVQITVVETGTVVNSNLSIHFLELGNQNTGDSVYIKAGDTDILIDAGSREASAATIAAYVDQFCTDNKLEYVIVTHAHQDHIAGFVGTSTVMGIFERYECENIIQFALTNATSQIYNNYCTKRDAEVDAGANLFTALECYNNSKEGAQRVYDLTGDGSITMEVLYQKFYEQKGDDENDYSVCVMIHQGENHYLFTGDLEEKGEKSLAQSNPNLPEVVLFKGGHHGSYTASNEVLLSKIKPQYVCVCCCAGNVEYTQNLDNSFPAQAFIDRVSKYTDRVYVTTLGKIKRNADNTKWQNDGYESMNGNIVFSCINGVISLNCSNNNTKLKDTDWFKNYRTCPVYWQEGTQTPSMYHD